MREAALGGFGSTVRRKRRNSCRFDSTYLP
jgi:hypothetical protein